MHNANNTSSKNATMRVIRCNFMRQGGVTSQCSSWAEEERPWQLQNVVNMHCMHMCQDCKDT